MLAVTLLFCLTATASADTRIESPAEGIAVSASAGGDLYVTTRYFAVVQQLTPAGALVRSFDPTLESSQAIAVDNSCAQQTPPKSGPECEAFDPSYGDVYVANSRRFRVEKYSPTGQLILTFGGEVDKTTGADLCTVASGDTCGAGLPGTGPAHFYKEEPVGANRYSWSNERSNSIAVGPDGTVYVGDYGRIQEFHPTGAFAGELKLEDPEPQFVVALAIDSSGDLFERSATWKCDCSPEANGFASEIPGVREYAPGPGHAFIRTFDAGPEEAGSEPTHIATDAAGDLFLSDADGSLKSPPSGERRLRAFKPTGALYAEFTGYAAQGIAIGDEAGKLYASTYAPEPPHIAVIPLPQPGPPTVGEEHVTDIEPTTATLRAVVNPEQFDTHYQFQYITEEAFKNDGNAFGAGTVKAPEPAADLGSVSRRDAVQAAISGLTPGTAYRWRVVATSECDPEAHPGHICETKPEETFETLPAVSIRNLATQTVGPEEVVIKAELDNNNSLAAGHWEICLGSAAGTEPGEYSLGCREGTVPAGSSAFAAIKATFTGLNPDTTYHYRLFAENQYTQPGHPEESGDQTLTTELSTAEERAAEHCPNTNLREQDSALALPDCRDWEQVSPSEKNGFTVGAKSGLLAPSGQTAGFGSTGGFAGTTVGGYPFQRYVAERTPSAWLTHPTLSFPAGPDQQPRFVLGYNAELTSWLFDVAPGTTNNLAGAAATDTLYLRRPDGSVLPASPTLSRGQEEYAETWFTVVGQAADFSRIFIATPLRLLSPAEDPRPSENFAGLGDFTRIYEIAGASGPSPTISLAAEVPAELTNDPRNNESPFCEVDFDSGGLPNPSSSDGTTLFYTAPPPPGTPEVNCAHDPFALFAHFAGHPAPLEISTPPPAQCSAPHLCATAPRSGAVYQGSSPDGRLAWFITAQPLVNSDSDETTDLYLAKVDPEHGQLTELVQASAGEANPEHPTPGQGAGVQGVVRASADGTHVAFVATGVLTTEPSSAGYPTEAHETAAQGADNLYLYDAAASGSEPRLRFIARLCSASEESGSLHDPACPTGLIGIGGATANRNDGALWAGPGSVELPANSRPVQFTPDGRYLLFDSFGRLAPGDTDNVRDVYRYDFQTGRLIRLSFGRRGNDANGNDDAYEALIPYSPAGGGTQLDSLQGGAEDGSRAISAGGSTVIFNTAAPLVSRDTNAAANASCGADGEPSVLNQNQTGCDVYEWEEDGHGTCAEPGGCISLISDGLQALGAHDPVISASGNDVTFFTTRGLVPADTDGVEDLYDARVNGGFHFATPERPCEGAESCHGEATKPGSEPNPVTETNKHGPEPIGKPCKRGYVRKHGRCMKARKHRVRHHHRAGRANRGGRK